MRGLLFPSLDPGLLRRLHVEAVSHTRMKVHLGKAVGCSWLDRHPPERRCY